MADIWSALNDLQWAGLRSVPSRIMSFSWENALAERRAPYVDDAWHDDTGRGPLRFVAKLYFDSSIKFNAFPELWNEWRPKLLTGEIDNLRHPLLGLWRARVASVSGETPAENRSGFTVDVNWTSSLDDPEDRRETPNVSLIGEAVAAENGAKTFNVTWPDGSYTPSLEEAIRQLESGVFGIAQGLSSYAAKVQGTIETMIEAVDRITDPLAQSAFDGLINVWNRVDEIRRHAERSDRQTATARITTDMTLDQFADSVGNSLQDVMQLNLAAIRFPIVRAPAQLVYYV